MIWFFLLLGITFGSPKCEDQVDLYYWLSEDNTNSITPQVPAFPPPTEPPPPVPTFLPDHEEETGAFEQLMQPSDNALIDYFSLVRDSSEIVSNVITCDFDQMEAELTEIEFTAGDRTFEHELIERLLAGAQLIPELYNLSDERLLYISDHLLKSCARPNFAFQVFRERYRHHGLARNVVKVAHFGYILTVRSLLRKVIDHLGFALEIIHISDSVAVFEQMADRLIPVIDSYIDGMPILFHAVVFNRVSIVKWLITVGKAKVNPDYTANLGSILFLVRQTTIPEIITILMDSGAILTRIVARNITLLLHFVTNRVDLHFIAKILSDVEFSEESKRIKYVNIASNIGETPLTAALKVKDYRVIRYLLDNGANPNVRVPAVDPESMKDHLIQGFCAIAFGSREPYRRPCLNWAIAHDDYNSFLLILKKSQYPFTSVNYEGCNALLEAVQLENLPVIKTLIDSEKFDVNQFNPQNMLPALHYAVRSRNKVITELLLPLSDEFIIRCVDSDELEKVLNQES